MRFKVVFEEDRDGGYTVYVPSLPGGISEEDDKESALHNIKDAIELYSEPVDAEMVMNENSTQEEVVF